MKCISCAKKAFSHSIRRTVVIRRDDDEGMRQVDREGITKRSLCGVDDHRQQPLSAEVSARVRVYPVSVELMLVE